MSLTAWIADQLAEIIRPIHAGYRDARRAQLVMRLR